MWPTLRSWSISPATAEETQTTAATPSTAETPLIPVAPTRTIRRAAMIRVEKAEQDDLDVEVLLDAGGRLGLAGGLLDVAERALETCAEVLAHPVEGETGADEHAADGA